MLSIEHPKRRRPIVYALGAFLIAAATFAGLEAAGTSLTSAHSGLGGKLVPVAGTDMVSPAASRTDAAGR